jgi:alanyl-tRNA synthetase
VLRVPAEQLPKTAERFFEEWKAQQKEIERLKEDLAKARLKTLVSEAKYVSSLKIQAQRLGKYEPIFDSTLKVVKQKLDNADMEELIETATRLSEMDYVAILGGNSGKVVAAVGKTGIERGVKAGDLIKAASKVLGGGGGGRPELAQGGGPLVENLDEALLIGERALPTICISYDAVDSGDDEKGKLISDDFMDEFKKNPYMDNKDANELVQRLKKKHNFEHNFKVEIQGRPG